MTSGSGAAGRLGLRLLSAATLCFFVLNARADMVGPATVAKADFGLWPEAVNAPTGFDKASRAALLVYVQALQEATRATDQEMQAAFKVKSFNRKSVDSWIKKEIDASLMNFQLASKACAEGDWTCAGQVNTVAKLVDKAKTVEAPVAYANWRANLAQFAQVYVAEQLRLAALFPKVSSEIDRFNVGEWTGDVLPDRHFYLTFDDGPSTAGGSSSDTLKMLAAQKKSGVFFMLGQNLQARLSRNEGAPLTDQYKGQCVASHGWEHQSHAKWEQWEDSVKRTHGLLRANFVAADVLPLFRPPYGQRKADSEAFFQAQGLHVALWNLDSQDWNSRVSPEDIFNRMLSLMLIKRHGVLLFHDIHAKAQASLPHLFEKLGSSVTWGDCHELTSL